MQNLESYTLIPYEYYPEIPHCRCRPCMNKPPNSIYISIDNNIYLNRIKCFSESINCTHHWGRYVKPKTMLNRLSYLSLVSHDEKFKICIFCIDILKDHLCTATITR